MPDLEFLSDRALDCTYDIFFETLVLCVRNSVLKQQKFIDKNVKLKRNRIINFIKQLKYDYEQNFNEITLQKHRLNILTEENLKSELSNFKIFEVLNSERITPNFMSLVRSSKNTHILSEIVNDANITVTNNTIELM